MPWHIVEESSECPAGKPYAVVKDSDGSVAGCHATRGDAEAQLAALYASEPGAARGAPFEFYSEDQERDEQGRFGPGGGGEGKDEAPRSAEDVANMIARGEDVTLPANEVSMLLDKMAEMSRAAKDAGDTPPTFDLCQATVEGTNLFCGESHGFAREEMPQLKGDPVPGSPADSMPRDAEGGVDATDAFKDALGAAGYSFERDTVPAETLKATQSELVGGKVGGIMGAIESGAYDLHQDPIFVSKDGYVLDGHHRWAAAVGAEYRDGVANQQITMDVIRVDAPILELVQFTNDFTNEIGIAQKGVKASAAFAWMWLRRTPFFEFYSEDQERDEQGRFGSGEAESISAVGGVQDWPINSMSVFPEEMQDKMLENLHDRCGIASQEVVEERYAGYMDRAIAEGRFEEGRTWYDREHENARGIGERNDVSMERVCGALAAMSAGADWNQEMAITEGMIQLDRGSVQLNQDRLDLLNGVGKPGDENYQPGKLEGMGFPPIENGTPFAAIEDSRYASVIMQSQYMQDKPEGQIGWGVGQYGYKSYGTALDILRNDEVDTRLNGLKYREFYNNLSNPQLGDHVTIDKDMFRAAADNPKFENNSYITGYPGKSVTVRDETGARTRWQTGIGPSPILADAVRNVASRPEYNVTPLQAQAIIWTQWKAENGG